MTVKIGELIVNPDAEDFDELLAVSTKQKKRLDNLAKQVIEAYNEYFGRLSKIVAQPYKHRSDLINVLKEIDDHTSTYYKFLGKIFQGIEVNDFVELTFVLGIVQNKHRELIESMPTDVKIAIAEFLREEQKHEPEKVS